MAKLNVVGNDFLPDLDRQVTGDAVGLEMIFFADHEAQECFQPPALHPHLVHEIAVHADQRRRAGLAPTSDALEEWHQYSLPSFTDRMKTRLRSHCQEDHQSWPAKGRHTRHIAEASRHRRMHAYAADLGALKSLHRQTQSPRLGVVDLDTGEIKDL